MLLKKFTGLLVVVHARHDEERHPCACLLCDLEQVVDEALEDVQLAVNANFEHSLRVLKAEAASLSARKQYGSDLASAYGFKSYLGEAVAILGNVVECRRVERLEFAAFLLCLDLVEYGEVKRFYM